jgi:hypothetical protein
LALNSLVLETLTKYPDSELAWLYPMATSATEAMASVPEANMASDEPPSTVLSPPQTDQPKIEQTDE